MAVSPVWRRVTRHFSISAPRMAVRTHLGWPWRAVSVLVLLGLVGGMWWWGFDFGQILGGFNRKEIDQRIAALQADADAAHAEASTLRTRNSQLESDLAIMQGTQSTLARQVGELQEQNAAMKDELAFLHTFFDGSAKPGIAIQRLAVDANGGDVARYTVLVVRGGNPKAEFEGQVVLGVDLVPAGSAESAVARTLSVPDAGTAGPHPLTLRFKYHQRLEGTFAVPAGYAVRAVTARVYEAGSPTPRASRALTFP